jgi:hypothetical protein
MKTGTEKIVTGISYGLFKKTFVHLLEKLIAMKQIFRQNAQPPC